MSKAEDRAKQYREFREQCGIKDPVMLNEIEEAYYEGYEQAKKDMELTWKDINNIKLLTEQVECDYVEIDKKLYTKDFYEEVLKRFKAEKENDTTKG